MSVDEIEMLSFFEVLPTIRDPDIPSPYNCYCYLVKLPGFEVSCTLKPAYKDINLTLKGENIDFELDANCVEDVKYHDDKGIETLELVMNRRDTVLLQLRPKVQVTHIVRPRI
jgi:hypothetical protein